MIFEGLVMGAAATALMDVWSWGLSLLPGQPPVTWAPVGRWVRHLPSGRVFHEDIGAASAFDGEAATGWAFHYGVGVVYGLIFVAIVGEPWLARPSFLPAWIFGIVTVGAGWFLLQPALGLGWAAAKLPNRWTVRLLNLVGHTVFAAGLYGAALALR